MKQRYPHKGSIVSIEKPTDLMRSVVACCGSRLNSLFTSALMLGGRNEWMVFVVGLNDHNMQRLFPAEAAPPSANAGVFDSKYGKVFNCILPVQVFDHAWVKAHPFTAPLLAYRDRNRIGTDCFCIVYAHGQVYVGGLRNDLGACVESRAVPDDAKAAIDGLLPSLIPDIRAVLSDDSRRFGVPVTELAYHVQSTVNRDSVRPLSRSEFESSNDRSNVLVAVDAFPFKRFVSKLSEYYAGHTQIIEHIQLPMLDGCFRVCVSIFGTVAVMDFPVMDPARLYERTGVLS